MTKVKKLTVFERGSIVELRKQGLSQLLLRLDAAKPSFLFSKMVDTKNLTGTEPEDPIGCLSRHRTILNPN